MTIHARYFGKTTSFATSDTPDNFTVGGANDSKHVFIVQSDEVVHVERSGADADPATSLRIPADTMIKISTVAGDVVSFVKGTGATDGTIWFTATDS